MARAASRDLSFRPGRPSETDPLPTSDIAKFLGPRPGKKAAGMPNSSNGLGFQAYRDTVGEHLGTENQVLIRGIFAPMMADPANTRHEHHGGRHLAREPLRVVAGA